MCLLHFPVQARIHAHIYIYIYIHVYIYIYVFIGGKLYSCHITNSRARGPISNLYVGMHIRSMHEVFALECIRQDVVSSSTFQNVLWECISQTCVLEYRSQCFC